MFNAIVIEKDAEGYRSGLRQINEAELPDGNVTVKVDYSTLNYKDGLAITGKGPVVRTFPMIPGIDLAGTVEHSDHPAFRTGDRVILNGWGVGEKHWGGLAQKTRLNGDWLIKLPDELTARQAMAIGTAGYTAMLSVIALEKNGVTPGQGPILVTGANGGVGHFAIAFLSRLGYQVVASTGRLEEASHLRQLGAAEVIDRHSLSEPGRPLGKEQWAAAVDTIGSHTLANVCAGIQYGGTVAACGLAQGMDFPASVAPFILRGITLAGIDSVMRPIVDRVEAWRRIEPLIDDPLLDSISREIGLGEVIVTAEALIKGHIRGRIIVDVNRT
ncbi:acrylyl-CoA reductase (NADPH) [Biostraticola tofi]|uniref:Acrylyl-CoA reductase (NADPH) n=1 Tax=Biostraticola tofi TaxID=466109 RepID=A0A4R3YS86_9GAMM|nr:MDR family oxidoreductase [Biostraticola tofi]TCV95242.1 acrylyl-CoA reductase (NADPH) [Biostraticola tofi]